VRVATAGLRAVHVYDTGAAAEPTGEVVAEVRRRYAGKDSALDFLLDQFGAATARVREWLVGHGSDRQELIAAVRVAEHCLEELGVVPAPVRVLTKGVEEAGGAAKVSGAGSLAGPGAGALLVVWPSKPEVRPAELAACTLVPCALGAAGLVVEEAA
jgi:mevalonate kinase